MDGLPNNEDYLLTLFEVCEILGKSSRTVTRYVHRHILHPRGIKSRQGTLEYRFSKAEVLAMKNKQDVIGRYSIEIPNERSQPSQMATFANLAYPPAVQPSPYIIPGISFPVAGVAGVAAEPEGPVLKHEPLDTPAEPVKKADATPRKKIVVDVPDQVDPRAVEPRNDNGSEGEIITLLKETTEMLRDQLKTKDEQIKNLDDKIGQLIERNRETNILLKGLQDKMVLLEKPKGAKEHNRTERTDQNQASRVVLPQDESPRPAPPPQVNREEQVFLAKEEASLESVNESDAQVNLAPNPPIAAERLVPRAGQDKADVAVKKGLFGKFFG